MQRIKFAFDTRDVLASWPPSHEHTMLRLDAGCMGFAQLQSVVDPLILGTIRFNDSHQPGYEAIVVLAVFFIAILDHMPLLHRWPPCSICWAAVNENSLFA
jgi:hypothetical protein